MSSPRPVFMIVPGAFHTRACMDDLVSSLSSAGYQSTVAVLASAGNGEASIEDDVFNIRDKALLPLIEKDHQDVVAVFHSFAGLPGSMAIAGLGRADRASKGLQGGIVGLIFMAAFIAHEGDSLFSAIGGDWLPWHMPKGDLIVPDDAQNIFYADVEESKIPKLLADLEGTSIKALKGPCTSPAYGEKAFNGRRAYIRCSEDNAIAPSAQDIMLDHSGCQWIKRDFKSSHSPFISQPGPLSETFLELAAIWA